MDRITFFQTVVRNTLTHFAEERAAFVDGLVYHIAFDAAKNSFFLVLLGWQDDERIYHLLTHIDIINHKVWIQEDQTEIGIANLLVEQGIPERDIVLAYFSEFHRQFTDFAVC